MNSNLTNSNGLWAALLIEELVRLGCEMFFISPGSRSSPLVAEIARHRRAKSVVHFDERGGAFAALGYSRQSDFPAVWVTTSGTAPANGYPAVVEASTDHVPMLLVTADRPPELRDSGANQTVTQTDIFHPHVRWFFDVPPPSNDIDSAFILTTADQAVSRSISDLGPVHLNCMFREPLALNPMTLSEASVGPILNKWLKNQKPYTAYVPVVRTSGFTVRLDTLKRIQSSERPVLVLGRMRDPDYAASALAWAADHHIPVIADVTSGCRGADEKAVFIQHHDLVLASHSMQASLSPDAVIQLGKSPVSKRLTAFLSNADVKEYVLVDDSPARIDPFHRVTLRITADKPGVDSLFSELTMQQRFEDWSEMWKLADHLVQSQVNALLDGEAAWSEQAVARRLARLLPEEHALMVGSSLPVRHLDSYGCDWNKDIRVIANRGASGIDGTIATAAGAQMKTGVRTTVFLGDLALLHDLNSLSLAKQAGLIVVVLNNDGGGIFSYLPIFGQKDVFESFFSTPHGITFETAASLFGLQYASPVSLTEFEDVYSRSQNTSDAILIELRMDRANTKNVNDRILELVEDLSLSI